MSSSRYQKGSVIGNDFGVFDIRKGGMGEVYFCFDRGNDTLVALKTIRSDLASDDSLKKAFLNEVNIWIRMGRHPNLVRCFGAQEIGRSLFVILELVLTDYGRPRTLRDLISRGDLSLRDTLEISMGICRGLRHASDVAGGVAHCDLKPENVLIGQRLTPKVTDWGLARIPRPVADQAGGI